MSGYRQSSYDPNAWEQPGPPVRPYNWVQWIGVALSVTGGAVALYFLLSRAGLVPKLFDDVLPAVMLALIGTALVNSRREPGTPITPEGRRKRMLIMLAAIAIAVIFAALAYFLNSQGA
jgi:hypothetical protein